MAQENNRLEDRSLRAGDPVAAMLLVVMVAKETDMDQGALDHLTVDLVMIMVR